MEKKGSFVFLYPTYPPSLPTLESGLVKNTNACDDFSALST